MWHNARGLGCDFIAEEYIPHRQMTPGTEVVGLAEVNRKRNDMSALAHTLRRRHNLHVYAAPMAEHIGGGSGCALIVRAEGNQKPYEEPDSVPTPTDLNRVLYRQEDGKALLVAHAVGGKHIFFLLAHLPHTPAEQTLFIKNLQEKSTEAIKSHKMYHPTVEWEIVFMTDLNFPENVELDTDRTDHKQTNAGVRRALIILRTELGRLSSGTLRDVYRTQNPTARGYTHQGPKGPGTRKRIDHIEATPGMWQGGTGIQACHHMDPLQLAVPRQHRDKRKNKTITKDEHLKTSDHSAIRMTVAVSTVERPPTRPNIRQETLIDKTRKNKHSRMLKQLLPDTELQHNGETYAKDLQTAVKHVISHIIEEQKKEREERQERRHNLIHMIRELRRKSETSSKRQHRNTYSRKEKTARKKLANFDLRVRLTREAAGRYQAFYRNGAPNLEARKVYNPPKRDPPITRITVAGMAEDDPPEVYDTPEGIRTAVEELWLKLYAPPIVPPTEEEKRQREAVLKTIRETPSRRLPQDLAETLTIESICHHNNIAQAVAHIKTNTAPGANGVPSELYKLHRKQFIPVIAEALKHMLETGELSPDMKHSVITLIWKEKGERDDREMYRPIAVTDILYRILARAVAQKLAETLPRVCGTEQGGFLAERRIEETILAIMHTMEHCNSSTPEEGGLFCSLDQYKAFDSVQWEFLWETMEAFGYPSHFIDIVRTMYKDITISIKINGHDGPQHKQTAGIRQGCPCSALLYLLVQEVLLRALRENTEIKGIRIPAKDGTPKGGVIKEKAVADDTGVMIGNPSSLPPLINTLTCFETASKHKVSYTKSIIIAFGGCSHLVSPTGEPASSLKQAVGSARFKFAQFSARSAGKYLGAQLRSQEGVLEIWKDHMHTAVTEMRRIEALTKTQGTQARERAARSQIASKVNYALRIQAPARSEQDAVYKSIQKTLDEIFHKGQRYIMTADRSYQTKVDMGFGHLNFKLHMQAQYAMLVASAINSRIDLTWTNFLHATIRKVYGKLGTYSQHLLLSNCAFAHLAAQPDLAVNEHVRACILAWGELPALRPIAVQEQPQPGLNRNGRAEQGGGPKLTPPPDIIYITIPLGHNIQNGYSTPPIGPDEHYSSPHYMRATTDPATAVYTAEKLWRPAGQTNRGKQERAIYAIDAARVEGRVIHLAGKTTQSTLHVTEKDRKTANSWHRVLITGKVPAEAVLTVLQTHKLRLGSFQPEGDGEMTLGLYTRRTPATTKKEIAAFRAEALQDLQARMDTREERDAIAHGNLPSKLSWEYVINQHIHFNPEYKANSLAGQRSTAASEEEAMAWAEKGIIKHEHLLHSSGKRWLTEQEFTRKQPTLQVGYYRFILEGIRPEWREAIAKGRPRRSALPQDAAWYRTSDPGTIVLHQTVNGAPGQKPYRSRTYYEQDLHSNMIREAGPVSSHTHIAHENRIEVRANRLIDTTALKPGSAKCEHARRRNEWTHTIHSENHADGAHTPQTVAIYPKLTLTSRDPVTMDRIRTKSLYDMMVRELWRMPRPFDSSDANARYANTIAHMTFREKRETLARWGRNARAPYLPEPARDLNQRILLHCLPIGKLKLGESGGCCNHPECKKKKVEENCEHIFKECPPVARAQKHILDRWEMRTGEKIQREDTPTHLFGARSIINDEWRPELDEPFNTIQALLRLLVWTKRNAYRFRKGGGQPEAYTKRDILTSLTLALNEHLPLRLESLRHKGRVTDFERSWVATGIARMKAGKPEMALFLPMPGDRDPQCHLSTGYSDGGFATKGNPPTKYAGWGAALYETDQGVHDESPRWEACGPVVMDNGSPLHIGANQLTNNTGELSGLYWLLLCVTKIQPERGGVHRILSDSTYALGRALTTDKPKANEQIVRRVRRQLRAARKKHGYRGVVLGHVRSHTDEKGNDKADQLATEGMYATQSREKGPRRLRVLADNNAPT